MPFFVNPFHSLLSLVGFTVWLFQVFVFIDAALRPAKAYEAAGKLSKPLWLVILGVAALVGIGLGLFGLAAAIATIVYWVDVRPALREVQGRGRSSGPYGGW
ncbi:MAG TPA: DUF2516 family protein [Mycobacteriales bacterium]|nr:DUF2516 family protein [Mycobacteriales bacterium]